MKRMVVICALLLGLSSVSGLAQLLLHTNIVARIASGSPLLNTNQVIYSVARESETMVRRIKQHGEEIRNGANVVVNRKEAQLYAAMLKLKQGMPLEETIRIVGDPSNKQFEVSFAPQNNVLITNKAAIVEQGGAFTLYYSPGQGCYRIGDDYTILTLVFSNEHHLTKFYMEEPSGYW